MPDLGVAHLALGQADVAAGRREGRVWVGGPELVEDRRLGLRDRVPGPSAPAPAVEDHSASEGTGMLVGRREAGSSPQAAASMIAAKSLGSRLAPPTSAPSTSGCESSSAALSGLTEPP